MTFNGAKGNKKNSVEKCRMKTTPKNTFPLVSNTTNLKRSHC